MRLKTINPNHKVSLHYNDTTIFTPNVPKIIRWHRIQEKGLQVGGYCKLFHHFNIEP